MKPKLLLIIFIIASLLIIDKANAVDFDPSISPITGGLSNVLLNFSITNNDAANNITKLNITLNSGFTYKSGARHDIHPMIMTFNLLESGTVLSWTNTTYIVNKSSTVYIWFYASTASRTGQEGVNISTIDNLGAFLSKNATLELIDSTPPKWSSNTTVYSVPTPYLLNKNSTFNVTWTDNIGLEYVRFEFNGANYTNTSSTAVVNVGSGVYGITFTDLPANSYNYRWFAKDWNNTENVTSTLVYNVSKAMNPIDVYFDGTANSDQTVNLGQTLNITVTGKGSVYLYENGTLIGSGGSPLTYLKSLSSRGISLYKVNGTSTANYTTNSTGATYTIKIDYPPPRYSLSTSIPTTWSKNSYASFNVTWSDSNDENGFSMALIQLNHSGTATNYTMPRIGSTNTSTYQLNLNSSMAISWRVYANNSYDTWNSTELNTSVISRITPTLNISVIPDWNIIKGTQTTVRCTSSQVDVILYRDGVAVSNPDVQTLSTGEYFYLCNNSISVNYSSAYESKLLTVYNFMAIISFLDVDPVVPVVQNSSNSTIVVIKNIGNATQTVSFGIENITSTWYSINDTSASIAYNGKAAFLINFTIGDSVELGDYKGSYKVTTSNSTYTYSFTLRVSPDEDDYETIENSVALYKNTLNSIWSELNQTKQQYPDLNLTSVEQLILEVKGKIDAAENYISQGNYYAAYALLNEIKSKIASAESEMSSIKLGSGIFPSWVRKTIIWIGAVIIIVLGYLLWPVQGYDTKSGKYRHETIKQKGLEKVSEAKDKVKEKIPVEKMKEVKTKVMDKIPKKREPNEIHITEIVSKPVDFRRSRPAKKTGSKLSEKISKLFKRKKKQRSDEYLEIGFEDEE